jgi:hypothetical protein
MGFPLTPVRRMDLGRLGRNSSPYTQVLGSRLRSGREFHWEVCPWSLSSSSPSQGLLSPGVPWPLLHSVTQVFCSLDQLQRLLWLLAPLSHMYLKEFNERTVITQPRSPCCLWTPEETQYALGFSLLHKCPTEHVFTLYGETQHASGIWTPRTCIKAGRMWILIDFYPSLRKSFFPPVPLIVAGSCEVHTMHHHWWSWGILHTGRTCGLPTRWQMLSWQKPA